ncbi:hypothetical protein C2E25_03145 [Geothermobacter hydrogeniphilus]|uniref:Uncharacterized protein n=1 Tax=Geothermobacter hydrogeniphilus TaxID=1969733 RepID=A0A2K2HDD0_9BACT|nr:DUF190 domain-containing protein [Geothermobacter hydrogeniphilus]PNU21302.1 hypothetical protein C2E25_03145 [Geothermobacter hydrogeniphilus]
MTRLDGELTLMRIFIGESDRWEKKPLYDALLALFRERGLAGATVIKCAAGYGGGSVLHTDKLLRFSSDLPVIVEVVDKQEKIDQLLPELDRMITGGMITLEKARVIRYF